MAYKVERLTCPGCGAPITPGMTECDYGHPVNISTFNSVYSMPMPMVNKYANAYRKDLAEAPEDKALNNSIGICYLKLKLYEKALPAFEKAMEDNFDNSESFFYAAICVLKGRKPFLLTRPEINQIIDYINAAIMIEPRGIYYYFLAYIKYDYFERKYFNTTPNYRELLTTAAQAQYSQLDVEQLFNILGTERPSCM